ncbi:DUF1460 domain-containing protein [Prolixibacteraceae bacterium JC049]|nr:DUF1460 domain-containing protein [Prolixibacteraceae bacterium JC049]
MIKLSLLLAGLLLMFSCHSQKKETQAVKAKQVLIKDSTDNAAFQKVKKLTADKQFGQLAIGERIVNIGKQFLDVPYVGATLEKGEEHLVINLHELDCTTFLESTVALGRSSGDLSQANFASALQQLRYYNGKIDGYTSRIHYFGQWIVENEKLGVVENISKELGGEKLPLNVNFMSTHVKSYKALKNDTSLVPIIAEHEKELNKSTLFYVPENKLKSVEQKVQNGDLIAITTSIKGLEISHVGIAIQVNDRLHLMHASSKAKKVVISDMPLAEMLLKNRLQTGVVVVRVKKYWNE